MTSHLALSAIPKRVLEAIRTTPYTEMEILDAAIPAENMAGIYFLIHEESIVYVGQSTIDVLTRIAKHRREGKVFDAFSFMRCHADEIDEMEQKYITAFMPKLNFSLGRRQLPTPSPRHGSSAR